MLESLRNLRGELPRGFALLALAGFCMELGMGIQGATNPNFMVQELGIRPDQLGALESIREFPGFILVFIAALTMRIAEPTLGGIALLVTGLGIAAVFFVPDVPTLMLVSFVWSLGLHTWLPLAPSLALAMSDDRTRGLRLGQLRSVGALAQMVGMAIVFLLAERLGFRPLFLIAAGSIALAALGVLRIPRDLRPVVKPRLVFRRRYSLYYLLTFLDGCRKQVFMTFAVFAMVKVYEVPVRQIALLMLATSLVNLIIAPRVGRWIDAVGERRVLTINYLALVFVFLGYALVTAVPGLFVLYALDGVFFTLSLALTTYLDRIADPRDVMPTLSMGVTTNHIAAVIVPVTGGLLWQAYGYQIAFFGGAAIVLLSLAASQLVTARPAEQPVAAI